MTAKEQELKAIIEEIRACERCILSRTRNLPVPGEGNIESEVLFIGEGPGANENQTGRPFVGAAGKFLSELIQLAGFERKDVYITNVVKCRPPGNRDPLPNELSQCGGFLKRQIELIDPLLIVTLGRFSMANYFPFKKISAIHGQANEIGNRIVVPMFHPAAALHQPALKDVIIEDFRKIPDILESARRLRYGEPELAETEEEIEKEIEAFFGDASSSDEPKSAEETNSESIFDRKPDVSQLSLF